jgi:hypothetical protein
MSLTIPNVPKPRRDPMELIITIFDLKKDQEIRRHEINFHNSVKRRWLQKLMVWAVTNGHTVEIYNKSDRALAEGI